jgi:hypothetical protein
MVTSAAGNKLATPAIWFVNKALRTVLKPRSGATANCHHAAFDFFHQIGACAQWKNLLQSPF